MIDGLRFWLQIHLKPAGLALSGLAIVLVVSIPSVRINSPWTTALNPGTPVVLLAPVLLAVGATNLLSSEAYWLERQAAHRAVLARICWATSIILITGMMLIVLSRDISKLASLRNIVVADTLAIGALLLLGQSYTWTLPGAYFLTAMLFGTSGTGQYHRWAIAVQPSASLLQVCLSATVLAGCVTAYGLLTRRLPLLTRE